MAEQQHDHSKCALRVEQAIAGVVSDHGETLRSWVAVALNAEGNRPISRANTAGIGEAIATLLEVVMERPLSDCPTCNAHIMAAAAALHVYGETFQRCAKGAPRLC